MHSLITNIFNYIKKYFIENCKNLDIINENKKLEMIDERDDENYVNEKVSS